MRLNRDARSHKPRSVLQLCAEQKLDALRVGAIVRGDAARFRERDQRLARGVGVTGSDGVRPTAISPLFR